jgi:hypothetical protein
MAHDTSPQSGRHFPIHLTLGRAADYTGAVMSEESQGPQPLEPETPPSPPTFDEAVRTGVQRLQDAVAEFEAMVERIPEDAFSVGEAQVLEATAGEVETLVASGQIDFESAAYDSEAWYHIVEDLQRVASKLYDAIFLMRDVEKRLSEEDEETGGRGDGGTVL